MTNMFAEILISHIKQGGDTTAIVSESPVREVISYTKLAEQIEHLAQKFQHLSGHTIICALPHHYFTMEVYLALACAGANVMPVPCDLPSQEILDIAVVNKATYIFAARDIFKDHHENLALTNSLLVICDVLAKVIDIPSKAYAASSNSLTAKLLLGTSGTTGKPKTMVIDWLRLFNAGDAYFRYLGLPEKHRKFWNYLPLNYLGGIFNLFLLPLSTHATIYISSSFTGTTFLQFSKILQKESIDTIWLVPSILTGLDKVLYKDGNLKNSGVLQNLELAFIGTAPVDRQLINKFTESFSIKIIENYGLSETTFISSDVVSTASETLGKILPWIEWKVVENELFIKSPFLFDGYLIDGALEKQPADFFATGDLVEIQRNCLKITGRKKLIIKKGGILINLLGIEKQLAEHFSNTTEFAAIPTASEFYGEDYIIFYSGEREKNIENAITQILPRLQHPFKVVFLQELPKTRSGKIKRDIINYEI